MTQLLEPATAGVDVARWPDVAATPESRFRAQVARALLDRAVKRLGIRVETPGGRSGDSGTEGLAIRGSSGPLLRLHRPDDFYRRLGVNGLIGFGEAYQAGDWSTDDLAELLATLARHVEQIVPPRLQWIRELLHAPHPVGHRQHDRAEQSQHRGALRPLQRHVPGVPGRDDDLLVGAVRPVRPGGWHRSGLGSARRCATAEDRPAAGPDEGRRRCTRTRNWHRLG